jgi:protein tyrosine phosphatase (PTP) superfamily phosphohydrolase (DUF442 family)
MQLPRLAVFAGVRDWYWEPSVIRLLPLTLVLLLVPSVLPRLICPTFAAEPSHSTAVALPAKPRDDLPGLKNFAQVSDTLFRGAQPSAKGFSTLKARGIKTIVNLRWEQSDRSLLAGTGLRYVEIPCNPWHPDEKQVVEFLKAAGDPKNQPVFVHCAFGSDRTGMMVGAYRMIEQGWTADDAINELRTFGYHPIYSQIVSYLKALDPATTRGKVAAAGWPKVEVVK